jgi:hypothetical protein
MASPKSDHGTRAYDDELRACYFAARVYDGTKVVDWKGAIPAKTWNPLDELYRLHSCTYCLPFGRGVRIPDLNRITSHDTVRASIHDREEAVDVRRVNAHRADGQ